MKIVLHHPVPLPPKDYGGVERVVLWLARGLLELGHDVRVIAASGSRLPSGVTLIPDQVGSGSPWYERIGAGVDIVHYMAPPGDAAWRVVQAPQLLTVHGNGKTNEIFPKNSVFLSQNHAKRHGARVFVYNGLDPREYNFSPAIDKQNWFLFLSKTSWRVKNLRGAMSIAKRTNSRLKVAGGARPLNCRLQAFLDPRFQWVGPVGAAKKAQLLSRAKGLLFPVIWDEPFGLVMIEAMVSGTPVFAYRRGSVEEVLNADVGRIFSNEDECVELLSGALPVFDADACRSRVLEKFHYLKMAQSYVELYRQVAGGKRLHDEQPKTLESALGGSN